MTRPDLNSLRLRLILGSVAGVALAMMLAGLFIGHLYRVHTTARFQGELDHHLEELVAMTFVADGTVGVAQPLSDPLFNVPGSGLYWQVEGAGTLARSPSLQNNRLAPVTGDAWVERQVADAPVLQRSVRHRSPDGGTLTVSIASARSLLETQVSRFRSDLLRSIAIVGLLLMAGAVLLVRFGFAPVRRLGDEIDRLRHGEIARLPTDAPTEFAPIVTRLNALLEGQAQLIARARTEAGNLAHDLRTPLALISDEAEQLRLRGDVEAGDFLLARCAVMQRQIDHHLARAAIAGTRGGGTLAHVAPLVEQIAGAMRRLHAGRDIRFSIDVPPTLRLPIDEGDLAEILSNLIDNGCKWARSTVAVTIAAGGIAVGDDGPGIAPDRRAAALAIGGRLDPATPGTGLGLAVVADLARIHDARFELGRSPLGGLEARVTLSGPPRL